MKLSNNISIIGSGSWATAIANILHDKDLHFNWYFRQNANISYFLEYKHNPNYLTGLTFNTEKISFTNDINTAIREAEIIILAVPSVYLKSTLLLTKSGLKNKKIVSVIKGIVPEDNMIISKYLQQKYNFPLSDYCVISGPSHAEEVSMKRLSYLTVSADNEYFAQEISKLLSCDYIYTTISKDVSGIEYAAILKNIMAIAVGICHGLNYGDNFQAVLVSNALKEIKRFLKVINTTKRDIKNIAYLGDLLVTAYSQFSRNRIFGTMIGKGYSAKAAILELNMVVEGYYALKWIQQIVEDEQINMPIINAVFRVIYENKQPDKEIMKLTRKIS